MGKLLIWVLAAGLASVSAARAAPEPSTRETCYSEITLGPDDDDDQYIFSPGYPNNYDNNLNCTWNITVLPTHLIRIEIVFLSLETRYDLLDIYNVNPNGDVARLTRLSGDGGKEIEYISDYNSALIQFTTDPDTTDQGFYIKFKATIGSKKCAEETLQWADGYVYSSGYQWVQPVCSWSLITDDGTLVGISMDNFGATYEGYGMIFYDGPTSAYPVLYQTNRTKVENAVSLAASSNQVLVAIDGAEGTSVAVDYGFYFFSIYSGGSSSCNFQYDSSVDTSPGVIKSPVFPHYYPAGTSCQWIVIGTISLVIETMNLPSTDTVTVYGGTSSLDTVLMVCSSDVKCDVNEMIRSDGSVLVVLDSKDTGSLETGYFKFKYYTNLDLVYETDDNSGFAVSPNYPEDYSPRSSHYYYISVNTGDYIAYEFAYFNTESNFDTLTLYDGSTTTATALATLSGSHTGFSGSTTGRALTMYFSSDLTSQLKGFMMTYSAVVTARAYSAYSEIVIDSEYDYSLAASPGSPDMYPTESGFVWYFTCSFDAYRIDFTFFRIDVDPTDFVKVFSGRSTAVSDIVTTIQGYNYYSYEYAVVYNTQATVWLYSAGSTFTGDGFSVEYWAWTN